MRSLLLLALCVIGSACTEIIVGDGGDSITGPSAPDDPSGPNAPGHDSYSIEYRVTGTATQVVVRLRAPEDGFNQVTTALPFSATVFSEADTVFLSLEATAITFTGTPYLNAQIFVDGVLFREAFTTSLGTTLQVTATYRRPED